MCSRVFTTKAEWYYKEWLSLPWNNCVTKILEYKAYTLQAVLISIMSCDSGSQQEPTRNSIKLSNRTHTKPSQKAIA